MDFFTPSLDRFPDSEESLPPPVFSCDLCNDEIREGDTVYIANNCGQITTFCESCFDDYSKKSIFALCGGKWHEARKE